MIKNLVGYLLVCASLTVSAQQKPSKPSTQTSTPAKTASAASTAKDAAKEKSALDKTLENVLSQIPFLKLDFSLDIEGSSTKKIKTGATTSSLNINFLEVNALVQFSNEKIIHSFGDENKTPSQVKSVIPVIEFDTRQLRVVAKASVKASGQLVVRFCQNYSIQNDYCEVKPLEVTIRNGNFKEVHRIALESITINFTSKIDGGNFAFDGTCKATKSEIDEKVQTAQKPVDCSFKGKTVNTENDSTFNYRFRFVTKTQ
ncbi:MAG: hypothetical protein JNL11_09995 [Bdellovibrionaceae bacterium]|nr:hypothetical protein [Pseudobdellovibrionaceae bacterium]